MTDPQTLVIDDDQAGRTVVSFLRRYLPRLPLSGLHRMVRTGRIRVNEKKVRPDRKLQVGDTLQFFMSPEDYEEVRYHATRRPHRPPGDRRPNVSVPTVPELTVIAEGKDWLAVAKPAGLLTHTADRTREANRRGSRDTLVDRVALLEATNQGRVRPLFPPSPVNRLDRGTSGVVLFGRTSAATRRLTAAFRDRAALKTYLAVLSGRVDDTTMQSPIVRDVARLRSQSVGRTGSRRTESARSLGRVEEAKTEFRVLSANHSASLVAAMPHTGRTHQIRAHAAAIGAPVLGDVKYGGRPFKGRPGFFLHAWKLALVETGILSCPLPSDWMMVLASLGLTPPEEAVPRDTRRS